MPAPRRLLALILLLLTTPAALPQEPFPTQIAGSWKITRTLPTTNHGCWDKAPTLLGTTLTYRPASMRWKGGLVPLNGVATRTLTQDVFAKESATTYGAPLNLTDLNITTPRVLEIDRQHEDADITGSTTEVPGDTILYVNKNTIVISACGTYFQATRSSPAGRAP